MDDEVMLDSFFRLSLIYDLANVTTISNYF